MRIWAACLALFTGIAVSSAAAAATISSSPSLFDMDMSAASSPPPYSNVTLTINFSTSSLGQQLHLDVYGALGASGGVVASTDFTNASLSGAFFYSSTNAAITDGVFSIALSAPGASFTILDGNAYAQGRYANTGFVAGVVFTPIITAVPEPATLHGLAAGFIGVLVALRWRRAKGRGF